MTQPATVSGKRTVTLRKSRRLPFGPGSQSKGPRSEARITSDRILANELIRTHQSIDFLKVSFWVQWDDTTFLETLDWLKKRMQDTDDDEQCIFNDLGLEWN